jgi:CRP/FNR family transcriptional regulator, cyclic AMP receptor protein
LVCDGGDSSPVIDTHLFSGLPETELRRLIAVGRRRRFGSGEVVFHRGDPAGTLHLVVKGHFAARVVTQRGDSVVVAFHGPGDAFGELALVDAVSRSTTVTAVETGETLAIGRDDFDRLRREYPQVNEILVHLLAQRVRRASDRLLEALFVPAETRVLRRLLELVELYGRSEGGTPIALAQHDIAALAGTSRATANRVLRAEHERGTLRLARGRTVVLDPDEIARRAHSPALDRA